MVDVYRNTTPDVAERAAKRPDLVVAHGSSRPGAPAASGTASGSERVISASRGGAATAYRPDAPPDDRDHRGAGKDDHGACTGVPGTGPGVMHTSTGTYGDCPGEPCSSKKASRRPRCLRQQKRRPLFTAGLLLKSRSGSPAPATLPSSRLLPIYRCAPGKKSALAEKIASAQKDGASCSLPVSRLWNMQMPCSWTILPVSPARHAPLSLKGGGKGAKSPAYAGWLPGPARPSRHGCRDARVEIPLRFPHSSGVAGRMSVKKHNNILVIDNANSGTTVETTIEAARVHPCLCRISRDHAGDRHGQR